MEPIIDPSIRSTVDQAFRHVADKPSTVFQMLDGLRCEFGGHTRWGSMESMLFIQFGSLTNNADLLMVGLKAAEYEIGRADESRRASCLYRIALAHLHLGDLERGEAPFALESEHYRLAKDFFRQTIRADSKDPSPDPLLDYAACLSRFGRAFEAIELGRRALALGPAHPIALFNLAKELVWIAQVTQDKQLFPEALSCLLMVDPRLIRNPETLSRLVAFTADVSQNVANLSEAELHVPQYVLNSYEAFCREEDLFLGHAQYHTRDSIVITVVDEEHDRHNFDKLARFLNEIRQSFATARLLAYETSMVNSQSYEQARTKYTDLLDGATYGTQVGKLRLAHEATLNILDKLAGFINEYLKLGIPDKDVTYLTLWTIPKTEPKRLRPAIMERNSPLLFALYDLHKELRDRGRFSNVRKHRHASTHRYLVVHTSTVGWRCDIDNSDCHVSFRELFTETLEMLRIVRNAVIYVTAFVNRENEVKAKGKQLARRKLGLHVSGMSNPRSSPA